MKAASKVQCRSCCPIANALDILGDRWTLLVIRDLMLFNKHEYREFMEGPEKIATNILADRLKGLLCLGIVEYLPHPKHKTKKLYYLTQKGKDLLPLMIEMILWGGTYHASPEMPKQRFNQMKRNPQKMTRDTLKGLEAWEKKHLPQSR